MKGSRKGEADGGERIHQPDRSYEEIGIIMNLKLSTVKTRMYRGRKRLKVIYESYMIFTENQRKSR